MFDNILPGETHSTEWYLVEQVNCGRLLSSRKGDRVKEDTGENYERKRERDREREKRQSLQVVAVAVVVVETVT